MIKILIPLGLLLVGWLVLVILARRNEKKVRSDWQTLLSPAGERLFEHAQLDIKTHTSMVEVAMNEAVEIKRLGDLDEALRFLNIGGDVIERFTPSLLSLLAVMAKFSRMVSAMAPVDPIVPNDFHLAEITNLAHLHRILHQMLLSTKQRFRLKLFILGKGLSITSRYLLLRIRDVVTQRSQADREWEQIVGISRDFQKLSQESVQSFHDLLVALSNNEAKDLGKNLYFSGGTKSPKAIN